MLWLYQPHAGADPWIRHTASQCPVTFGSISWSGTQASPAIFFENILPCCQLHTVDLFCILQMISLQCGVLSFAESACQSEGSCKVELTALPADCLANTALLPSGCQALQTILACNGEHHGDSRHQLWLSCTHFLLCILTVCAGSCQGTLCHFMFR